MAEKTSVVWLSYHEPEIIARGYWDQGILEDLFKGDEYKHFVGPPNVLDTLPPETGAVVVINGRTHVDDIQAINEDIAPLAWCLLIITGDEEGLFPWQEIRRPMLRVWVQLPRMNVHNDVSFKLPNGARPNTRELLKEIGQLDRKQDWFFAGQINHERREQCAQELKYLTDSGEVPNGTMITTEGFGQEKISYQDYLGHMAQSKIVLCPSGIETPDTFRLYEALEAGCLPVVDAFASRNQNFGFWKYLFDEEVPFPIVDYWDKLPALMPELLRDWPRNANRASAWWQGKKRSINFKLKDDIKELTR